jgi:NADPH2:quinone reductase
MPHAIRIRANGGPEVLAWEEVDVAAPGPGQALLRQHAAGLNYIDVYVRNGLYPQSGFPLVPGMEGAGEVLAVGEGVNDFAPGDRVAYAGPIGAYAEERLIAADRLVKLPDDLSYETGAAMMLKGMTAAYLLRRVYDIRPGATLLFHAAAGGVGLIACQWAKALGATVIGTAGSPEKVALALTHGCDHAINYRAENVVERVRALTGGEGVDVVYDGVGKDTYMASLDCLKHFGLFVSFGQASGPIPPVDLRLLGQKGSLFATRPSLSHYTQKREDLLRAASDLFDAVRTGKTSIQINQRYSLQDAARAHTALESRVTTGATVLFCR